MASCSFFILINVSSNLPSKTRTSSIPFKTLSIPISLGAPVAWALEIGACPPYPDTLPPAPPRGVGAKRVGNGAAGDGAEFEGCRNPASGDGAN